MAQSGFEWQDIGGMLPRPRKFVLVNCKDSPDLLRKIVSHTDFPSGAHVFTHELGLFGASWCSLGRHALRRREMRHARALPKTLSFFRGVAKKKNLKIWLGHSLLSEGRLWNAYSLVGEKGIIFTQRKKFLWRPERWLYAEPSGYEGNRREYSVLICSEVSAFFDPMRWSRPTRIPEIRVKKPRLVVVPAYWVLNKDYLLSIARSIARPYCAKEYDGKRVEKGIHPEGSVVFVVNAKEALVVGPVPEKDCRKKTTVYADLKESGWIEATEDYLDVVRI